MIRSFHNATRKEKAVVLLICLGLIAVGIGLGVVFNKLF